MLRLLTSLLVIFWLSGSVGAQGFEPVTTVCRSGPFTLQSPVPEVAGRQYRWERSFDGGGSWSITGTNAPALEVNTPTGGIRYRLVYAPTATCLADPACATATAATELRVMIPTFSQGVRLCAGDTLYVGATPLFTGGNHETILTTATGCDSIVLTFLQVLDATDDLIFVDLCPGELFRGLTITADTTFTEHFVAASGCDSLLTFEVSLAFPTLPTILGPDRICAGETAELEVPGSFTSFAWSTGEDADAIRIDEPGSYAVTLTDFSGCQLVLRKEVTVTELLLDRITTTPPACPGGNDGRIDLSASGDEPLLYSADGGETFRADSIFTNLVAGDYALVVENPEGCRTEGVATLTEPTELRLLTNLPAEQTIERGDSVVAEFDANFEVATWRWNAPAFTTCTDCPVNVLTPTVDTRFEVTASAAGGCSVIDSFLIRVNDARRFYAPTAFSPNDDDRNDVWQLYPGPRAISISSFQVADRWGGIRFRQPIEEIPPTELGWDGTSQGQPLPPGIYAWSASINYANGERQLVRGQITLVR